MKLKRIISLISSLAIVATMAISFETVSMAEKVDNKPEITVGTGVDEYGYYYVEYKLKMNGLGVAETKVSRDKYYSGIGINIVSITLNGVSIEDVYSEVFVEGSNTFGCTHNYKNGTIKDNVFKFTNTGLMSVSDIYAACPAPVPEDGLSIAKISTNYENGSIAEDELIAKFSDFGYTSIKTSTIPELSPVSYTIPNENITTYTVADDGYTKHSDADFALITPETPESEPDPEPPVQEDPKPGDIKTEETELSGSKKYLEIYDQNTQPRYVVIDTLLSKTVNAESVLKATYGDEEKTAKLFDLLTVDEGATGGITINNLTIKMVLPYGSEQPGADDFSFAVEAE